MPRNRFVSPGEPLVRLELSDGDWIDVKPRLSHGDELRLQNAMIGNMKGIESGGKVNLDGAELGLTGANYEVTRILVWVQDWSLCNDRGKQQPITKDTINALDADSAQEIKDALDAHMTALEEKKRATTTANGTSTPLLSVSG